MRKGDASRRLVASGEAVAVAPTDCLDVVAGIVVATSDVVRSTVAACVGSSLSRQRGTVGGRAA